MQTKREWLASKGLAIAGARGKFSNEAKAALAKAESEGMKFSDATTPKPVRSTGQKAGPAKQKSVKTTPVKESVGLVEYLFPNEYRFPEEQYRAVSFQNGKKVYHTVREVCNTCRVSLTNHKCDSPTISTGHGTVSVKIERR